MSILVQGPWSVLVQAWFRGPGSGGAKGKGGESLWGLPNKQAASGWLCPHGPTKTVWPPELSRVGWRPLEGEGE